MDFVHRELIDGLCTPFDGFSTSTTQKGEKRGPIFFTSNIIKTSTTLTCSSDVKTTHFSGANEAYPKDIENKINSNKPTSKRSSSYLTMYQYVFVRLRLWQQFRNVIEMVQNLFLEENSVSS